MKGLKLKNMITFKMSQNDSKKESMFNSFLPCLVCDRITVKLICFALGINARNNSLFNSGRFSSCKIDHACNVTFLTLTTWRSPVQTDCYLFTQTLPRSSLHIVRNSWLMDFLPGLAVSLTCWAWSGNDTETRFNAYWLECLEDKDPRGHRHKISTQLQRTDARTAILDTNCVSFISFLCRRALEWVKEKTHTTSHRAELS